MRVLLDTCVVSELRRRNGNPAVREAVMAIPDNDLYLSVLTIGEIAKGVALLPSGEKRRALESWIQELQTVFADRLLPVDATVSTIWGEITARAGQQGVVVPAVDGLIAATALRHGLHLMTRNVADFAATGVLLINPWQE